MELRSYRKVHLTNINDILKNIAVRKYIISYCRENEGFISINYNYHGVHEMADLTSSYSIKNASIPENSIVELDVQGPECEKIIDYLIENIDAITPVE